jgi:hypothetical protein
MATIAIALLAYLFFMIETVQLFQSCDYFFSIKLSHLQIGDKRQTAKVL